MNNKKVLLPVFVILIASGIFFIGSQLVNAQADSSGLAAAIASKFNLKEADVQNVITAYTKQQQARMQQTMKQRQKSHLDSLVSQGKITSDQETQILQELARFQSHYSPSTMQSMTQTQRQQARQNEINTLTQWANSNGINPQYVLPFGGHRGGWNKLMVSPALLTTP